MTTDWNAAHVSAAELYDRERRFERAPVALPARGHMHTLEPHFRRGTLDQDGWRCASLAFGPCSLLDGTGARRVIDNAEYAALTGVTVEAVEDMVRRHRAFLAEFREALT